MQVGTNAANNLPGLVLSSIEADCCRNIEVNIFSFRHCKRDIEHIFYKISDLNFHSDHVLQNGSRVMHENIKKCPDLLTFPAVLDFLLVIFTLLTFAAYAKVINAEDQILTFEVRTIGGHKGKMPTRF